jgi:hypothetical protein
VVAADVADPAAMTALFAELAGHPMPLRGVVHAAGVSEPQFVRDVTPEVYRRVWRPKVLGGWLLHRLCAGQELDIFLGFSSIAATWGSQHLASYAAGNAFLDGLAQHRRAAGLAGLAVDWGPWELASDLFDAEVLAFLTATGLRPLSAPQCLRLLGALLAGEAAQQVVCAADWAIYKPVMEARRSRPMLATIEVAESAGREDVVVRLLPASVPALDSEVEVAAIERLYTLVLNFDPEASFCFSEAGASCNPQTPVGSHARVLREISLARDRVLALRGLQRLWQFAQCQQPDRSPHDRRLHPLLGHRDARGRVPLRPGVDPGPRPGRQPDAGPAGPVGPGGRPDTRRPQGHR